MKEPTGESPAVRMELAELAEALGFMKADASRLLNDMTRGISMWGVTALLSFLLAAVSLALAQAVLTYAHPYGALPQVLDLLYASYLSSACSAVLGLVLAWRYFTLKTRYVRLFEIARKLR
jgi:hypothetical protein